MGNDSVPALGSADKPEFHRQLIARQPAYMQAVDALGRAVREAGPLDAKTLHLIQLAGAAASHSEGSVHSHTRRAIEHGATAAEIEHALVALTSTIGFPQVVAALSWVQDELERL